MSGSSLLFPSVIWNVITHHFRVRQEPDTYISLSASLSFFHVSLFLPLFLAVFVCWWRIVYFPPPHIFEHYPYHYLCKWLGLRQAVYRTTSPTLWLNECFYMHTGSYPHWGCDQENLFRICKCPCNCDVWHFCMAQIDTTLICSPRSYMLCHCSQISSFETYSYLNKLHLP